MKRRQIITFILVVTLLFLVSCGQKPITGEQPQDTAAALQQVRTGTQGVDLKLIQDYPPATLYDQNELVAILEVKNKGNYDLDASECFVQVTGFDPNIILGDLGFPRSCADSSGILEGKNIYNIGGGFNQIEFRATNLLLPRGVFEYNPTLNFKNCYYYKTTASPQVCVDPLRLQISSDQLTCNWRKGVDVSGGQGAPVGVSYVGVDMIGNNKAFFEINIQNYGGGSVITPYADLRRCGEAPLDYTDSNKIAYNVQLSGGSMISCNPADGLVRLNNNQGKITCKFSVPGTNAFETPLLIELDYGYLQSLEKTIKIIQTPE
jgi:hypothetical protein